MKILPLHSLGRTADVQICPRRRYWHWEHLGTGIEPCRIPWKLALESVLCQALPIAHDNALPGILGREREPDFDCSAAMQALAVSPGISGLNTTNPADEVGELSRLAGALALAWQRRRAPIMARSEHQPATLIIGVSQHQPATDRPDSRLFDLLINEEEVMLEWFVLGQRWDGFRFNNPLLYYWATVKDNVITWQKPEAKAMCYEPISMQEWIQRMELFEDDPIGKVLLGGRKITLGWYTEEHLNRIEEKAKLDGVEVEERREHGLYIETLSAKCPMYFHSCRGCDCAPICWGPEPFPIDATEAYPNIFKKRNLQKICVDTKTE